jgi:hypothetical protein
MEIVKTINKEKVGFKFTMKTLDEFSNKRGIEFHQIFDSMKIDPFGYYLDLFWSAIKVYNKGKEPDIYIVDDYIDIMSNEDMQEILDVFTKFMEVTVDKMSGEKPEKKAPGAKS